MEPKLREQLRGLPGVDAVLSALAPEPLPVPPEILSRLVRRVIAERRESIQRGETPDPGEGSPEATAEAVRRRYREITELRPRRVLNATGVLLHTNLGRAPLSRSAIEHMSGVAMGYSDLEFELESGERGSRQAHVTEVLRVLTGAEDALVVNNNAAAVVLALAALAAGREVVVSRGELVEIGGSFRIPEILEASGARLREVGTTNRTHLSDYERAIGPETALLLKVHASNYRIEGFTREVDLPALVALGRARGLPALVDLGSGAFLDVGETGMRPEPLVETVVEEGPDLLTLSGDKLLGGPQAGIVVGRAAAVARLRSHPLARAVRIDKLLLAALHATLVAYLETGRARREIPVLGMMFATPETVRNRAEALAARLREVLGDPAPPVMVERAEAAVGGGTLPQEGLATFVVALDPRPHTTAARFERALRHVRPALLGRIREEQILLDLRTVSVDEEGQIPGLIREAWATAIRQGA